jgi:glycosyltransferase involved in cell wall biosynthesis
MNEERAIGWVIDRIPREIRDQGEVIVADASRDRTARQAEERGARVLRLQRGGKGRQVRAGVEQARGEILVLLDGDGEHPPSYIPALVSRLEEGCDLVLGTRNRVNVLEKPLLGVAFLLYLPVIVLLFRMAGLRVRGTPLTGFRCMRAETWKRLDLKSQHFLLEAEMNVRMVELGLSYEEVHIPYAERWNGITNSRVWKTSSDSTVLKYILLAIIRRGADKIR